MQKDPDSFVRKISLIAYSVIKVRGGDERARTADPLLAKQVLSQLSYIPASWFELDHADI